VYNVMDYKTELTKVADRIHALSKSMVADKSATDKKIKLFENRNKLKQNMALGMDDEMMNQKGNDARAGLVAWFASRAFYLCKEAEIESVDIDSKIPELSALFSFYYQSDIKDKYWTFVRKTQDIYGPGAAMICRGFYEKLVADFERKNITNRTIRRR
jgi:hypothetical protein